MAERAWVDRYAVPTATAVAVACWLALIAVLLPDLHGTEDIVSAVVAGTASVPALLGWRIVHLDPGNAVGRRLVWLALALTALWGLGGLVEAGLVQDPQPEELWVRWVVLLDDGSFVLIFLAAAAVVLVFPDGRAPTPAWAARARWWNRLVPALLVLTLFSHDEITVDEEPGLPAVQSPLPGWEPLEVLFVPILLLLVAALVGTAVAVRGRYRRASGIERLQLSWFSYAAATVPLTILTCIVDSTLTGSAGAVTVAAIGVGFLAIPVAVGIAVLRYRLYEIERLINRTLVYVALTAALGAAYAAVALGVGIALGGGAAWATGVATLVVAVAFRPARDRMQRAVDRRFARRRYEGLRLVERFIDDVRAGSEDPERIGDVLARAFDDRGLEVFFRLPATGGYADSGGRLTAVPEDLRARTPVRRGELELGVLLHDPGLHLRADTFERILRAASLPIEIARLRVEVRVQLAEVETSRARIIAAAAAERRKLERDLHDGAQQRLVALGLALRHAQSQLDADPAGASGTLDAAVDEVTTAVAELREIARGLRPGVLDGSGLAGALSDLAGRSPVPLSVEVTSEALPPHLEATTFFLACEAVTNAIKHAGARHIRVRVDRRGELLLLEVADDGLGGALLTAGGGLAGLTQRAAAAGGRLVIESPDGRGTRIRAELPVGLT